MRAYDHIAVLLDDVWLPATGPRAVSVSTMLATMAGHNFHAMSPAIAGAWWPATSAIAYNETCLRKTKAIEVQL